MRKYVRVGLLLTVLALAVLAGGTPAYAWSYPAALNTNAATDSGGDYAAQVATDGAGNWLAVWHSNDSLGGTIGTDHDILVARSTNKGATWTAPVPLNTNATSDSVEADDSSPQVATDGAGHWVAVWSADHSLGGADADILVARSTNNGATWTAPGLLNSNGGSDSGWDKSPAVTTDGLGNWVAVWHSNEANVGAGIGTDYDILVARSTDNGANWTAPAALNTNAASDSGNDWWPDVTTDGAGQWVAVWSFWPVPAGSGDADVLVARSTNNGLTWTDPAALNTNASTDSGDDDMPDVATDGAGNWLAVWHSNDSLGDTIGTDYDILVARSTNNGLTWIDPAALNTNAATDSGSDGRPNVTTDPAGNWVAVWDSTDSLGGTIGTDRDVLVARSTNNGVTWTAPAPLNTNATSDSGDDYQPQVATDGAANWVTAWHSNDSLGGTIGTDYDILRAQEPEAEPVGGIAELPDASDSAGRNYAALAGLAAAALVALGAGGWYARRRLLG
jgi:hypothetical protein